MEQKEVLAYLGWQKATFVTAVTVGIELPGGTAKVKLRATKIGDGYQIEEADLDEFQQTFHDAEPGRHPPVAVMRNLSVESIHRCGICKDALPLQYHHIIEWSELKHYDVNHMLSVCGGCHDLIRTGRIDRKSQYAHKRLLTQRSDSDLWGRNADSIPWAELAEVIEFTHTALSDAIASEDSKFDYSYVDLETIKNPLNNLRKEYFDLMRELDEPHFRSIEDFLRSANNPASETYYRLVDALRRRMLHYQLQSQPSFESVLFDLVDAALHRFPDLKRKRRTLDTLLSFMYFNCDIGRKS